MKTKRFDFNFRPLQINTSLCVEGSVPDRQNYDADTDAYTPDYTLAPLVITPRVSRIDKDNVLAPGPINPGLANIRWYKVVGGTRTQIQTSDTEFAITPSGADAGKILVKTNVQPGQRMTLEFYAEYPDERTGQVYVINATHTVACRNATEAIPRVLLDAADQTLYNPLRDPADQTVHARLMIGAKEAPDASRQFVWEVFRADNTWAEAGSDLTDFDIEVAADGCSVTVHRALMGHEMHLRCRAKYSRSGDPSTVVLDDSSPSKIISFARRIPAYDYDFVGVPMDIPADVREIKPQAVIRDTVGVIADPGDVLRPVWYMAQNKSSGTLSYSKVAEGVSPVISTSPINNPLGAVIGLEIQDRGPLGYFYNEDNPDEIFVDETDPNAVYVG